MSSTRKKSRPSASPPKTRTIGAPAPTAPNLVDSSSSPRPDRASHFFDWRFFTILAVLVGVSLGFAGLSRVIDPTKGQPAIGNESLSFFEHIGRLVETKDQPLRGEADDRINLLLLGIGGPGHDGAYLADTIILVSLKPSTGQVAMLSIPRDFYVPIPGHDWRKINNANAFGREDDYPGGGEQLTADILSRIFDLDIPYYARVDFAGFRKIINDLGGITVNVQKGFVDTQYPTEDYGYQTISFRAGVQAMDGEKALKYVRSRKSTSDFDRSRRQQDVLVAVREKALSFGTLLNPIRISDVLTDLGTHTRTNLELWEMVRLAGLVEDLDPKGIVTRVLDSGAKSPLQADSTPDGAYILRPRAGWDDWSELREIARDFFAGPTRQPAEMATIVVQNGTKERGLADRTATALKRVGFTVLASENARERNVSETSIVDLTGGTKLPALRSLQSFLSAAAVLSTASLYLRPDAIETIDLGTPVGRLELLTDQSPDFLVLLGSDDAAEALISRSRSTRTSSPKQ